MTKTENKPHGFELGDILREHAQDFLSTHKLCPVQLKAMKDIIACRTHLMKGHLSQCDSCGYREQSYNSCRNRHCNKCQLVRQSLWAGKLKGKLIPGRYFHLVFTVPESLNKLFYINQQSCYSLLFKVAWSALNDLCNNPRFLGAQTGAVAILHTWSSTMTLPVNEFIRRFMQHILPCGFYKIRYFGIFATANIKSKREQCLALTEKEPPVCELEGLNNYEAFRHITGSDPSKCKKCKTGKMIPVLLLNTG